MMKKNIFVLLLSTSLARADLNIPLQKNIEPPTLLSKTGLFQGEMTNLQPAKELITYDINQALWVDFAKKLRFLYLPPNKKIIFSENEAWGFPVGTVLVKHFKMETSYQIFKNVETRILVRQEGEDVQNWVGYTYQWGDNDATLVDAKSSPNVVLNVDATADGGARIQNFKIPSRKMCLQCHNSSVGFVRSVRTEQINREFAATNQLIKWNTLNLFEKDIGSIDKFIKFSSVTDPNTSLEERTKTYLDVNCAHCHNPDPAAMCNFTGIDFRYDKFNVESLVASEHLVKGSKESSVIFQRMNSEQPGLRMPYIGSQLKDNLALDVIGAWIDGLR